MTYARFLALFVVLPLVILLARRARSLDRLDWRAMGVLLVIVYATASPWDNVAVKHGLWDFDPERIWGVRLFWLPLEEYLFFGLQTLLTGTWVLLRLRKRREAPTVHMPGPAPTVLSLDSEALRASTLGMNGGRTPEGGGGR